MSRGSKGVRGAAAGFAFAAAGVIYARLGGRRRETQNPAAAEAHDAPIPSHEVQRARAELADELARRSRR